MKIYRLKPTNIIIAFEKAKKGFFIHKDTVREETTEHFFSIDRIEKNNHKAIQVIVGKYKINIGKP